MLTTSVCVSVCLSVRPHEKFRKYSLITTKLTHVNMCHPSMHPIENGIYVAVILFLQACSKEIRYITVIGRHLFKVNFSSVKISVTQRNFYMSFISTPVYVPY